MAEKYKYRTADHFHTPRNKYNRASNKRNLCEEIMDELDRHRHERDYHGAEEKDK